MKGTHMGGEVYGRRAVVVEPQSLFVPFIVETLGAGGLVVVDTIAAPYPGLLTRLQPDVLFLDLDWPQSPPLSSIRQLRQLLPLTCIVMYTRETDPVWRALALALGANAVVGAEDELDVLTRALASPLAAS